MKYNVVMLLFLIGGFLHIISNSIILLVCYWSQSKWRLPSLSELTQYSIQLELTHFDSKASKCACGHIHYTPGSLYGLVNSTKVTYCSTNVAYYMEGCRTKWCNCQIYWTVWVNVLYTILASIAFGGYISLPCRPPYKESTINNSFIINEI